MRRLLAVFAIALCGSALLPALAAAAAAAVLSFAPTEVRNREATARFAIDPGGLETTWLVELGQTDAYGREGAGYNWPLKPSSGFVPVEQLVGGRNGNWGPLLPGVEYHYRVAATNADGTTYGEDRTLTAANGTPPVATNLSAVQIAAGAVVLNGTVDPEGSPLTVCRFHYVTDETFQHRGFSAYGFPLGEMVRRARLEGRRRHRAGPGPRRPLRPQTGRLPLPDRGRKRLRRRDDREKHPLRNRAALLAARRAGSGRPRSAAAGSARAVAPRRQRHFTAGGRRRAREGGAAPRQEAQAPEAPPPAPPPPAPVAPPQPVAL